MPAGEGRSGPAISRRSLAGPLAWTIAALVLVVGGCATDEATRRARLIEDARYCEADADAQVRNGHVADPNVRMLLMESCMAMMGW